MSEERIGILGGSFNPPHLGHVAMAEWVLENGKVAQVWVIPCLQHPFAKPLVSFEHRYQMCDLAFQSLAPKPKVLDIEKRLGGKSYTYRTILQLKKENPDKVFSFILGGDAAEEATNWDRAEDLKKEVEWIVIPRGKGSPTPNVSATMIRNRLTSGKNLIGLLPKAVIHYIQEHKLYR